MLRSIPLPAKQIALLSRAQAQVNAAQSQLDIVAQTILSGLEVEGQIVSVDTTTNVLNLEVAEFDENGVKE